MFSLRRKFIANDHRELSKTTKLTACTHMHMSAKPKPMNGWRKIKTSSVITFFAACAVDSLAGDGIFCFVFVVSPCVLCIVCIGTDFKSEQVCIQILDYDSVYICLKRNRRIRRQLHGTRRRLHRLARAR